LHCRNFPDPNLFASLDQAVVAVMSRKQGLMRKLKGSLATTYGSRSFCANLNQSTREAPAVDLALKLDVLAVCAVFAFVGAILLGAF
jgi:hypothetical protein